LQILTQSEMTAATSQLNSQQNTQDFSRLLRPPYSQHRNIAVAAK
jgi:hypothetical protein